MSVSTQQWDDSSAAWCELFVLLLRKWWWIASAMLVCIGVAAIIAYTMQPVYRASATLVPASSERSNLSGGLGSALGQLGGLVSLTGLNVGAGDIETEEALAVIRSRQFTETFIQDNNLLPKLFAERWDNARSAWKDYEPTLAQAYKYFDKKVRTVIHDKKTGLVTLQIDWADRGEAAAWANELVQRLNTEMRSRSIAKADASVKYLERELDTTTVIATREAINRLIEAQIKQRMLANVTLEYAFRTVDRAMVPDRTDRVRPKRILMLAAGAMLGLLLGVGAVLVARSMSVARRTSQIS